MKQGIQDPWTLVLCDLRRHVTRYRSVIWADRTKFRGTEAQGGLTLRLKAKPQYPVPMFQGDIHGSTRTMGDDLGQSQQVTQ